MDAGSLRCGAFNHWAKGGAGAVVLADAVVRACKDNDENFRFLYELDLPKAKIEAITKEIYGADGVDYSKQQRNRLHAVRKGWLWRIAHLYCQDAVQL
jgi:formyltetrahydrofolate synthetase